MLRIIALIFLFLPAVTFAQTTVVRSGEHSGFTRLVLTSVSQGSWNVLETNNEILIDLKRENPSVDTSQAFDRINQTRIQSINVERSIVRLKKACECGAKVYEANSDLLVIDVFEDPQLYNAENAEIPTPNEAVADVPSTAELMIESLDDDSGESQVNLQIQPVPVEKETPTHTAQDLSELRHDMSSELAAALTRGLLNPDPAGSKSNRNLESPSSGAAQGRVEQTLFGSDQTTSHLHNLNAQLATIMPGKKKSAGRDCAVGSAFDIASWKPEEEFLVELSNLRRALYQEFDMVDEAVALELARLYAYSGFGAEALSLIALSGSTGSKESAIVTISEFLEYGTVSEISGGSELIYCENAASLWSFLAVGDSVSLNGFDEKPIIREFMKLPKSLKALVAPLLSAQFREIGFQNAASLVLRDVNLHLDEEIDSIKLEEARLETLEKGMDETAEVYEEVAKGDSLAAPIALAEFIDFHVENKKPISKDTAVLAQAYAMQFRNSEIGPRLVAAHIKALSRSGQFFEAVELFKENNGEDDKSDEILDTILSSVAYDADEIDFLQIVFDQSLFEESNISPGTVTKLAERLQENGMWQRSKEILDMVPEDEKSEESQVLLGNYYRHSSNPAAALPLLQSVSSQTAMSTTADIFFESGDFERAQALYEEVENAQRSEISSRLMELEDQIATVTSSPDRTGLGRSLESASQLLSESEVTRSSFAAGQ